MTPEEEEAGDRLLFHLENQTGFWFALVVGDDPGPRARLCEAARSWCTEHGRTFLLHEPEPQGLVMLAVSLASGDSPGIHWIRADGVKGPIEAWSAAAARMLMAMNERREAYRKRLEGGIVVEGRSSLKRILREMAPDLFSIRAFIAEPGADPKAGTSEFPEWRPPVSLSSLLSGDQVDVDLALARLARLSGLETPTSDSWIEAENMAMVSLFNAGRHHEAEEHAHRLLSRIEQGAGGIADEHALPGAQAYDLLARIAVLKSGDVDEALRLWDHALTILGSHEAHDKYDRLIWSLIATEVAKRRAKILLHAGKVDEARSALESYVSLLSTSPADLPPEMQVDLVDAQVMLADVLAKQGDFSQAEEVLSKAMFIAEEHTSQQPQDDRWQLERLRIRSGLGRIYLDKEDIVSALKTLVPVADLAERMEIYGSTGQPWQETLERYYSTLAFVLSHQLNYSEESDRIRQRALASMKRTYEEAPDNVHLGWYLAGFHLHRTKLLEKEDLAGAKESAEQALDLVTRLPVQNDENAALKAQIEALRSFVGKPRKKRGRARR